MSRCPPVVRSLLAVVLAWAGAAGVRAQPVFDVLTRARGLPSDYVFAVHQDRHGFVWLGTDAGLARYDGARVETFTPEDGLPHTLVYAVAETPDGTLYAGTFRGLARFERASGLGPAEGRFVPVPTPVGDRVTTALVDGDGRLVVVGPRGIARREGGRWRVYASAEPINSYSLLPLPGGRLLCACAPGGPALLDPAGGAFRARPLAGLRGPHLRFLDLGDGTFLAWGLGGPRPSLVRARIDGARAVVLAAADGPGLTYAHRGPGGALYAMLGTGADAYAVVPLGPDLRVAGPPLLRHRAEAFAHDYEGGLWIGTFGAGAYRLRARHLTTLTETATVRVVATPDGAVWATGDALVRVDPVRLRAAPVVRRPNLRALAARPDGRLLYSGDAGLFGPFDPRRPAAPAASRPLHHHPSWFSDVEAATDTVWASTYGAGVRRSVGGRTVDSLGTWSGLPTDMVENLVRTRSGLWLLTRSDGALRMHGRRAEPFGPAQGLPSSSVFAVYEGADGTLWFGTDRGVGRVRRGAARARVPAVVLGKDVLRGQRVVAFFERAATPGVVWAVGDRTLYRIAGEDVRAVGAFPLLPAADASVNAALYHPATDRLFLASSRGLVAADLAALPPPPPPPRVAFRGARVDGRPVVLGGTPEAARLAGLAPGRHRVEVAFAPLTFAGPAHAEYRLGPGPWRGVEGERGVVFPDLGPGAYRLEVRAVNADGVPSARPAVLAFRVRPHLWQRPWTWAVGGLALVGLGGLVARALALRRLRARVAALEADRRLADARERLSRDLHDHVGGQLTTLVAAADLVQVAVAHGDAGRAGSYAAVLGAEARTALRGLRQTVTALRHDALSLDDLFRTLREQAEGQLRFHDRPRLDARLVADDAEAERATIPSQTALQVLRVAQEAVTNALKHARADALTVELARTNGTLALTVADDGAGFAPPADADGSGLAIMRARAAEAGGTVTVGPGEAGGTAVRLRVPVRPPNG